MGQLVVVIQMNTLRNLVSNRAPHLKIDPSLVHNPNQNLFIRDLLEMKSTVPLTRTWRKSITSFIELYFSMHR